MSNTWRNALRNVTGLLRRGVTKAVTSRNTRLNRVMTWGVPEKVPVTRNTPLYIPLPVTGRPQDPPPGNVFSFFPQGVNPLKPPGYEERRRMVLSWR